MIFISNSAQIHLAKMLENQKEGTQIRIFVINPGAPNAECGMSYCSPDTVDVTDIAFKFDQFTVYIDKLSLPYLEGTEIDLIIDQFNSQLTLKTPNVKLRVSSDVSLMERIAYFLQSQINPQLASHGGFVSLIEITDESYAILQFDGGCKGCSMVNFTLKDMIEKQLMNEFPDLKGVQDITDHQRTKRTYC